MDNFWLNMYVSNLFWKTNKFLGKFWMICSDVPKINRSSTSPDIPVAHVYMCIVSLLLLFTFIAFFSWSSFPNNNFHCGATLDFLCTLQKKKVPTHRIWMDWHHKFLSLAPPLGNMANQLSHGSDHTHRIDQLAIATNAQTVKN
jgi:hypothetical protein